MRFILLSRPAVCVPALKDASREREAADIRITAEDLLQLGICDKIVAEPPEGAYQHPGDRQVHSELLAPSFAAPDGCRHRATPGSAMKNSAGSVNFVMPMTEQDCQSRLGIDLSKTCSEEPMTNCEPRL